MNLLKNKLSVLLITLILLVSGVFFAQTARAVTLGELVELFIALGIIAPDKVDAARSAVVTTSGGSTASPACLSLAHNHYLGRRDSETNGEVSKLQQFLRGTGDYIYPEITGYFGPATEQAVQNWQRRNGVVSSGNSESTGYGVVGPKTRSAFSCESTNVTQTTFTSPPFLGSVTKSNLIPDTLKITYPSSDINIGVSQKITVTYSVGSNMVAIDPAIVERKIVNAGTDSSVSDYIPVSVSGGTFTFDWTPSEAGRYQVVLNISHNNTTYPARSGVITVGNPSVLMTTNTSPSITFSYISSGNVIASYANLPSNSQIRFVNSSTGQRYGAQSTMVWGGGNGSLSIPIPNDLPVGTYHLRATDYYNSNTIIAQSSSFQAGSNVQTNSVVINSLTASPATINPGQAVLFTWSSNLSQTDVSYYSGGCSIEGLTASNQALQVTPGFVGANGSTTYTPSATATYTLRCHSGGKDGSPSASRQITVNVVSPQTDPVVISSFTASSSSVPSGQPVTFTWNSNLTPTDISYSGGCSIEALTTYNQAIQITSSTFMGANGSVTYTPALTATYTLRCTSGGKDGAPLDEKQVTVSVN